MQSIVTSTSGKARTTFVLVGTGSLSQEHARVRALPRVACCQDARLVVCKTVLLSRTAPLDVIKASYT